MKQPPDRSPADDNDLMNKLDRSTIALPLFEEIKKRKRKKDKTPINVIIDLNLIYGDGRESASTRVAALVRDILAEDPSSEEGVGLEPPTDPDLTPQYRYARLTASQIRELARRDSVRDDGAQGAVYKIWYDHPIEPLLTKSVSTVKADAAKVAFAAMGEGVLWAVVDSGIDKKHPHFRKHRNLILEDRQGVPGDPVLTHQDYTTEGLGGCEDGYGHGTHVAGIIAGELSLSDAMETVQASHPRYRETTVETHARPELRAITRVLDEHEDVRPVEIELDHISGVAPKCKLLSLKVLDSQGRGKVSNIIKALGYVQTVNEYGRWLHIHGVNLSVGYEYEAEWFACGQSPLCVEVDRLVRSGVAVVVAAGNTGYGFAQSEAKGAVRAGIDVTINDPGNAERAITVGSTHREKPHVYGVSYFSSKGPTGDGRAKPDLVAPGEKIISCAAGKFYKDMEKKVVKETGAKQVEFNYVESSGTSMAAPHVSGAIAAFYSIRREFLGDPERAKEIFMDTATDLGREKYFQGRGLVDVMRAIQSV